MNTPFRMVWLTLAATALVAQDQVFIGDHNGTGNASPLYVWETGWSAPVHSTLPNEFLQQRGRGVIARHGTGAYAGKILVFHATTYSGAFIRQYTPGGGPGAVPTAFDPPPLFISNFGGSTPIHQLALNYECTRLYLGRDHGSQFTQIEEWDVSNLSAPTLLQTITVPGIETMSLSPDGKRIIGAYAQGGTTIVQVDLTTTTATVSTISLSGTDEIRGDIRVEPTVGQWAYFPISDPGNGNERKIGILNLATTTYNSVSLEALLGGDPFRPASIAFDTLNDRVYFGHPSGATRSAYLVALPSAAAGGGFSPAPALVGPMPGLPSTAPCNTGARATYTIEFSPATGILYMTSACNGVFFSEITISGNSVVSENTSSLPNLGYGYYSLAVASAKPVKLTVKAVPAPDPLVSVNGGSQVNAVDTYLNAGSSATLAVNNATQPVPLLPTGPKYDFQKWVKASESCPNGVPFGTGSMIVTTPLQLDTHDTYCACFEKSWYLNVTVDGSCTATASGWHAEGATPTFSVTAPAGTTVTVTGDATVSGQTIAMNQPKNVTVTCTSTSGPGGCSLLSSHSDLVGWYRFEEPSSQTAFADSSSNPAALNAVRTVQRGAGKVGSAVYFDTTPFAAQLFTPAGGSAATTTTSPAKYNFGTGAFSIDFWINLNGSLPNGRPILQKMSGLATNEFPFPPGTPRPPEFGYRLRTIAGEFLELELASNGTFAKYAGSTALPVSQWVHVTVVVPRGSSLPIFYINGVAQTASGPTTFTGTLDNTAPLLVGDIAGPGTMGGPNRGTVATRFWLDELELFKTALTQADVTGLVSAGSTGKCVPGGKGCAPAPAGMITWYTLDAQATGEADIAGATRTALNWAGNPQSITGRVGNALRFTTANYAEAANAAEGSIATSNLSIDAWIRTSSSGSVQTFVDKRVLSPTTRGYSFFLSNGSLAFQMADAGGASNVCSTAASSACTNWVSSSGNLADGNWHHVAVTVSRTSTSGGTFYVDGQPAGSFDPTVRQGSLASTALLRIGSHASGGQYAGDVDELEVFDRELTAAEVRAIFDAGPAGKCRDGCAPQPAGMSAWWRFEEASGPHFNDSAGTINDIAQIGPDGIQRVAGQVGQAVRMNATNQALTVPPSAETQFLGPGSIDLWIRTIGNPLVPIVDRNDNNNYGYQFYLQNGNPVLKLFSAGMSGTWTSSLQVPANQWVFLAVTFNRTSPSVKPVFYVNGQMDANPAVTSGSMPTGAITPNVPLLIGALRPLGQLAAVETAYDELEIFQRELSQAEVLAIFNAGPLGKCRDDSQFPVTVDTLPANIGATVGLSAPAVATGTATHVYTYAAGTAGSYHATASPATLISSGTQYTLSSWSFNGSLDATLGTSSPTAAKSVTGASTFTANYRVTGYEVTVNNTANCAVSVGGQSQPSTYTFVAPAPGMILVQPGTGSPTTITLGSGATLTLPAVINPSGPVTITPNCAGTFTVTVNTTPVSLGVTVGISAPANVAGTGTNTYSNSNATAGNYIATATPSIVVSGTQYSLFQWLFNSTGDPSLGTTSPTIPKNVSSSALFTAAYRISGWEVTVNNTAACSVTVNGQSQTGTFTMIVPSSGGSGFALVQAGTGNPASITLTGGTTRNLPAPISNITGPLTITPNCTAQVTHTVLTNPAALRVTIDGGPQLVAPQTTPAWAQGSSHALGAQSPQFNSAGNTRYDFVSWNGTGITAATGAIASAPATSTTYTANFDTLYQLTVTVNGNCAVNPQSGFYPAGSTQTVNVTPSAGVTLSGITFAQPGAAGLSVPNGGTITMTGPGTLTVNCGVSNISLTLITNPAALTGTIGSFASVASFLQSVPSGVAQSVSVATPQMSGGAGYQFVNWTGPVANTNTAATTVTATTNTTITANFSVYCYVLTVNASPSGGGRVQVSPATGGLAGVPSNCYRPGTQVTLTATPGTGFGNPAWTGATGSGATATVVMDQPRTVTATFSQVTTVNPNDAVFLVSSRAGGNLSMDLSNRGATAIQNLRITAVTNISNGFTLNMTLPRNFAGALNPGANTGFNMFFTRANGDRDAAFSFTMTVQADNLAPFTRTINVQATATATLVPTAVSRTNTGNVASLAFRVDNTGTGHATQVIASVAIQSATGNLVVNNSTFPLGTIAAGGSANLAISPMGSPGSNVSGVAFNVTLTITYIAPSLTATQVSKSWHFDASGGITPL